MMTKKIFLKKNKLGNCIKTVKEHYLRDDLFCGFQSCNQCESNTTTLSTTHKNSCSLFDYDHHLIIDTNVALHQIDILEEPIIGNVIVLNTVLQEVRHRSLPIFKRLVAIIDDPNRHFYVFANDFHQNCYEAQRKNETPNDYNDRIIRRTCLWYRKHLKSVKFILLSDDAENRRLAEADGVVTCSVERYVQHLDQESCLVDKLSQREVHYNDAQDLFPAHLSLVEILTGIKTKELVQGTYHASRENFLEGYVTVENFEHDIIVQGRKGQNRAVDGDTVAVRVLAKSEWIKPSEIVFEDEGAAVESNVDEIVQKERQLKKAGKRSRRADEKGVKPTGEIIGIVRRKWRQYCGILQADTPDASLTQLFVPSNRSVPKIRIETRQATYLKTQKIIVSIDSWPRHSRYPHGHFVRAIGKIGEQNTENEVVLLEHDVPHSQFSEQVLRCLPKLPWIITEKDVQERVDLRYLDICSVDPPGCTDIDDALHCRRLENGQLEVGVHIADVTHFIRPGTAIDLEAQMRATTVYLVNRRIDMVPDLLSSNLCSLRGGEERFAFSCVWEMTDEANILRTRYHKSIIRSRRALTYEEAQLIIDDTNQNDSIAFSLRMLNKLAKVLKKRRLENGALVLASPEVKIHMDSETMDPIDVEVKKLFETNSMVEEFMLLGNISVAERILADFPECAVLRRHPEPPKSQFDPLVFAGRRFGFEINVESGKKLAASLDDAINNENPYFNTLLRIVATRCMLQAVYFPAGTMKRDDFHHYGLAVPLYTHFTSPIRRYADVLVHRLLAAAIDADSTYPALLDKSQLKDVCANLNYRNRMAQMAGRASVNFNTHLFFRGKMQDEAGYVVWIKKNALSVLIPRYGLESTLFLSGKNEQSVFEYCEDDQSQRCGDTILRVFDPVVVRLCLDSSNVQHEKIMLRLVKPYVEGFSVPAVTPELDSSKRKGDNEPTPSKSRNKKKKKRLNDVDR